MYGKELILDIHECDPSTFNRKTIRRFFRTLCETIDMVPESQYFWDDPEGVETEPHIVGTSAIQFIRTSNVTLHSLDMLKRVYLNIFSCKEFDSSTVKKLAEDWFNGTTVNFVECGRV